LAEWLYEDGIGEARAVLVADGCIVEARIEREGAGPLVGTIAEARIVETIVPRLSALVAIDGGGEAMLDNIPSGLSEGRTCLIQIVREPIAEHGRPKRAKAIPAPPGAVAMSGPALRERLAATGHPVRQCFAHEPDALEAAGWSEVLDEAERGEIAFDGGALRMALTPAMTLFDVDGSLPAGPLAEAAATAVCAAIFRHSIGGSIGIDFPTLPDRASRRAVDAIIDKALPQPFERTAINGFGFLQIVRRRPRGSLPELLRSDPAGAALRATLRRIERDPPADGKLILPVAHAERLRANPGWIAALSRRTGRTIEVAS
jgi:ribonuclease G